MAVGIFDRTSVIHGDEKCRDGHYRVQEDVFQPPCPDGSDKCLDPNDTISLQAQPGAL